MFHVHLDRIPLQSQKDPVISATFEETMWLQLVADMRKFPLSWNAHLHKDWWWAWWWGSSCTHDYIYNIIYTYIIYIIIYNTRIQPPVIKGSNEQFPSINGCFFLLGNHLQTGKISIATFDDWGGISVVYNACLMAVRTFEFYYQWEFQHPNIMGVLYHIRPYFVAIFPYIALA